MAAPGSERVIFDVPAPSAGAHNSGALHFGPDGKLYVAVGDIMFVEWAEPRDRQGQDLAPQPRRLDPCRQTVLHDGHRHQPRDLGLWVPNPFRMAVQRTTGRLFANDVGNGSSEETNDVVAGDYGWVLSEGPTTDPRFITPTFAYPHQGGAFQGCAIVGGASITRPRRGSGLRRKYFFADYCKDWIRLFDPRRRPSPSSRRTWHSRSTPGRQRRRAVLPPAQPGAVQPIAFPGGTFPVPASITDQPEDTNVVVGGTATFTVSAEGTPPLAYQWSRAGTPIANATAPRSPCGRRRGRWQDL